MFTVDFRKEGVSCPESPVLQADDGGRRLREVFEVGHAYRAELHNTWRHLSEYVSMDVEMGFIESYEDLMDLEEGYINTCSGISNRSVQKELEMYGVSCPTM